MLGRGEHAEITSFVGNTVDSELSGNMIDLCPVGALTSKPFRYSARTWELSRRKSVSPHDGLGANLVVQVKNNRVMRVLPRENEAINECWLSDKDRFSYEGLNSADRLTQPMLKQGGAWRETDWGNRAAICRERLEEDLGRARCQFDRCAGQARTARLKNCSWSSNSPMAWVRRTSISVCVRPISAPTRRARRGLGMPITDLSTVDAALVVGSFLRRDHPCWPRVCVWLRKRGRLSRC